MPKRVLLVNGPPGSGKDTVADYVYALWGARRLKFAEPLKASVPKLFNLTDAEWVRMQERDQKEKPQEKLFGMTPRTAQIWVSEDVMKPQFGEDVFGRLLWNRVQSSPAELFVVSDSGFQPEAEVLIEKLGAENLALIRLSRPGCSFDGDSRDYVHLNGVHTLELANDRSLGQLLTEIHLWVAEFYSRWQKFRAAI